MVKILPHEKVDVLSKYKDIIEEIDVVRKTGKVERIAGLTIESVGPEVKFGELCKIRKADGEYLFAEVVGINKNRLILMPIGDIRGVTIGAQVIDAGSGMLVPVGEELLGRVLSGTGIPIDGKGPIYTKKQYPVDRKPINPLERVPITQPLSVGIRAIDGLLTVGRGQRMGIFSGSGIGKSTLIAMMARFTDADVNVIALIGERGREVRDFIDKELGEEGLKRSVVVAATSDQPPMVRIRGAFVAHAIAEFFRDQGMNVNLLMDSVTRFALAQREVGLAAGEPSATRGYPPSVFSLLPKLLERSGTTHTGGSITGFYSILVEADDMNEPIADAVRGILDGHIVLDRELAHRNHYPAIDVLGSISRCMKDVVDQEHLEAANRFREILAAYKSAEDLILLGAYKRGSDVLVDRAIDMREQMNAFLKQGIYEKDTYESIVSKLKGLFVKEAKPVAMVSPVTRAPYFAPVRR
ncbi:MAG: flagellar protein export ATPase FliI [Spirochaetes bacterium]|nr:flagellar protein export ATPase FliI [Spirochaetota bacterium]